MKVLTSDEAFKLLLDGDVETESDLDKPENKWIYHSIYVGLAAKRIAKRLNLDDDYACALGYIHDIGRKISHPNHPMFGYNYLQEKGYEEEARICLTHSFVDNDIELTAGQGPTGETYLFLNEYLEENSATIYDNIVQLCDLFCLSSGYTTIEKRLFDVTSRKGVCDHSKKHYEAVKKLQQRIEKMLGCPLYTLFPEISKKDLQNTDSDLEALLNLFDGKMKIKKYE